MISISGAYHVCKAVHATADLAYNLGYKLGKRQVAKKQKRRLFRAKKFGVSPTNRFGTNRRGH